MSEARSNFPTRSYMEDGTLWRSGKPDYSVVNEKYMRERKMDHKADSLERLVENLVKTWEMEVTHKMNKEEMKTVTEDYTLTYNGSKRYDLDQMMEIGNYNIGLNDCPMYNADAENNESSTDLFRNALPGGFAWEVLQVYTGPPTVTFKWRHWGKWEGPYKGNAPTGAEFEMIGSCVAGVTSDLKIKFTDVYFDPSPMMATLLKFKLDKVCPVATEPPNSSV